MSQEGTPRKKKKELKLQLAVIVVMVQSIDLSSLVPPLDALSIGATITGDIMVDLNMTRAARSASINRFLPFQVYNTIGRPSVNSLCTSSIHPPY